jgi:hypothetical protein
MDNEESYKAMQLIPMEIIISFNNAELLQKLGLKSIENSVCPGLYIPKTF